MPDPELIAQRLARCVELFRDPDAKQVQKAEFRALLGLLKGQTVVLTDSAGQLLVNGVAVQGKVGSLIQRMGLHNVGEITIQPPAPPSDVFELLRALSDQPALGTEDIPTRLRQAGVNQVTVAIADFAPPARVSGPTSRAASESDDVLGDLERNPQAPDVSRLLDALVRQVEIAFKAGQFEQVLTLIAGISRGHQAVPRGSDARRHYGIAFKRVYTKAMLDRLAHLVSVPKHRSDAILALQRAGAGGVKVLIDLLVAAPTMSERRVLFDALSQMKEGTGQLVQMLDHRQWFVVRNGAELVGALRLAGTAAAIGTIEGLVADSDAEVKEAAQAALLDLKKRR